MFEDFFNHKCNIYHLKNHSVDIGFGFDKQSVEYEYSDTPDIAGQSCHFHAKTLSVSMQQSEPFNRLLLTRKLTVPIGTDIKINDKVIDCETNIEYTAQMPVNVKNHHISVILTRLTNQEIM